MGLSSYAEMLGLWGSDFRNLYESYIRTVLAYALGPEFSNELWSLSVTRTVGDKLPLPLKATITNPKIGLPFPVCALKIEGELWDSGHVDSQGYRVGENPMEPPETDVNGFFIDPGAFGTPEYEPLSRFRVPTERIVSVSDWHSGITAPPSILETRLLRSDALPTLVEADYQSRMVMESVPCLDSSGDPIPGVFLELMRHGSESWVPFGNATYPPDRLRQLTAPSWRLGAISVGEDPPSGPSTYELYLDQCPPFDYDNPVAIESFQTAFSPLHRALTADLSAHFGRSAVSAFMSMEEGSRVREHRQSSINSALAQLMAAQGSLLETGLEAPSSLSMVTKPLGSISSAIAELQIGQIPKGFAVANVASAGLEGLFGWLPLLKELNTGLLALAGDVKGFSSGDRINSRVSLPTIDLTELAPMLSLNWAVATRHDAVANVNRSVLDQLIADTNDYERLAATWAFMPWSFIVDWWLDLSTTLNALSMTISTQYTTGSSTHKVTTKAAVLTGQDVYFGSAGHVVLLQSKTQGELAIRETYLEQPPVFVPISQSGTSLYRSLVAAALFLQRAL